jgi:ribonuclease E
LEERAEERPAAAPAQPRGSEAKEDGGGQARKGPRRRGRRGGRRGRSGQRPQRAPGEEGPAEGRIEAQGESGAPSANDANNGRGAAREEEAPPRTQSRETFASAVEPEASREAPADVQDEPETPRRRGWWQR